MEFTKMEGLRIHKTNNSYLYVVLVSYLGLFFLIICGCSDSTNKNDKKLIERDSLSNILLLNGSEIDSSYNKIETTFKEFQTALIKGDCQKIVELSNFPIEGDMGLARLLHSDKPGEHMKKLNYQITKELLIQNCAFLDSTELQVLTLFDFDKQDKDKGVKYNDCIYKSYIYIAEDKSYFQWSVGCVDLINQSIGEYSMIFTFKIIDGKYKLKQIHGAT